MTGKPPSAYKLVHMWIVTTYAYDVYDAKDRRMHTKVLWRMDLAKEAISAQQCAKCRDDI